MDESKYQELAAKAFRKVQDAFENVDPDDADAYVSGDVLTITFRNGVRCVMNTQRPTRQIWLAARAQAWHFSYDEASARWVDDKGRGDDLYACLKSIVKDNGGVDVPL